MEKALPEAVHVLDFAICMELFSKYTIIIYII